jgi:4'-phosphopantetheinyl transferase
MEEMDQIAEMNLSPQEYRKFQGVSKPDRLKAFYNCWTRKEAFIKEIGEGTNFPLHEFDVSFQPDVPAKLITVQGSREKANNWTMHDLRTQAGYSAAIVIEGNDHSISHKQWIYNQI